jgi:ribosomal peptide maturation radical SAM protein 1
VNQVSHNQVRGIDVALVQMPFAATAWPSLGLGLLKAALTRDGVASEVIYLNSPFADRVGDKIYESLSAGAPDNTTLLGEWVFSRALWGAVSTSDETYFHEVLMGRDATHRKNLKVEDVKEAWKQAHVCRDQVEDYLESCLNTYDWNSYKIVGFTSVFQQHVAGLALAKRLKARYPHLNIVFGGANCEGPMGLGTLRAFPFIDAVCIGEGDTAFPAYVAEYLGGLSHEATNVVTRAHLAWIDTHADDALQGAAKTVDLEALPYPDFDDFFSRCGERAASGGLPLRIIFETSRGCWWGQKNHCTFCGLNGTTMAFRYKSPRRAIDEIQYLLGRYGSHTQEMSASDNIIPYKYFDEFLPEIIRLDMKLSLFYETKANLRKEQVFAYRDAGMREIQPGIESLDTNILRLMRKGVSGIQNVQLLKWCKELGIAPLWNYLYGFPGEDPGSYDQMADQIESLTHLDPPSGSGQLRFDRFSPYVSNPEVFGIEDLQPYPAYRYLYPEVPASIRADMAYYFTGNFPGRDDVSRYTRKIRQAVHNWRQISSESLLAHLDNDDEMLIFDLRINRVPRVFALRGLFRKIVASADGVITASQLDLNEEEMRSLPSVLEELGASGLIFREGERFLSLSISLLSDYRPAPEALLRLRGLLVEQIGGEDDCPSLIIDRSNVVRLELKQTGEYNV